MKKSYIFITLFIIPMLSLAYDVEIDGIYYNLIEKSKTAEVTYKVKTSIASASSPYSGDFSIPDTILYEGVTYTVSSISDYAFYQTTINSIIIPNSVTKVGYSAFSYCNNLKSLVIPDNVTSIGEFAFCSCRSLKNIKLSNSITVINSYTFISCSGLDEIIIPNSVTHIKSNAFQDCTSLKSIKIPNSVIDLGSFTFRNCSNLKSVTIPSNLTYVTSYCFYEATGLESVIIPNSVNKIGESAFYGCDNLKTVYIPNSIKNIGNEAFNNCPNIENFYCYAEQLPYTGSDVFNNSQIEYATLYVPESVISNYRINSPWNEFGKIVAISDNPQEEACANPIIYYNNGKLSFKCDTEGAEFITDIKDNDIKKFYDSEIDLSVTYNISVYATKTGYKNSEVVTATLCWIDVDPVTEGISSSVASISARPILIQNNDGSLIINGAENNLISIYDLSGKKVGEGKSIDGNAVINTNLQKGNIAIVKIGNKAIKVQLH